MKFTKPMKQTFFAWIVLACSLTWAGELKFEIAPNFFETHPNDQQLGPCHGGVVIDKAGNVYVTTDTDRGIVVYSPAGKFLRTVGPTRIHGLEMREEDGVEYIYAARPSAHEVVKLSLDGERLWAIECPMERVQSLRRDGCARRVYFRGRRVRIKLRAEIR